MSSSTYSAQHTPPHRERRTATVVAVLSWSSHLGGAERGTIETAATDRANGRRWVIAVRNTGPGEVLRLCSELGVEVEVVRTARDVRRVVRRCDARIVYLFGLRWSMQVRALLGPARLVQCRGRAHRPRLIVAQRGLDVWRRPWHRWIDRLTHLLVDRYVANSRAAADMLIDVVGIPRAKVSVLPTGLGETWFEPPPRPRLRPGAPPRVIVVGNDRAVKALDQAVAALAAVADLAWQATFHTDVAERLQAVVDQSGMGERITVSAGRRVGPADYDEADLLLQTSIAESLPRVVLEALARGVRVVASDVGDTATVVPAAQVFPAGDLERAAGLLRVWLTPGASVWADPQPCPVARETDVADALCRLAYEP